VGGAAAIMLAGRCPSAGRALAGRWPGAGRAENEPLGGGMKPLVGMLMPTWL
jgi:hypothetical protein